VSLPALSSPGMQRLEEMPIDRETVDRDIGKAIRVEVGNIQMEETASGLKSKLAIAETPVTLLGGKAAVDAASSGGGGGEGGGGAIEVLASPLLSEFLGKVKVVEKRKDGMLGGWRACLAITTADNYLHLFDLPTASKITAGSASEVAFQQLIPAVEIPSLDLAKTLAKRPEKWQDVTRDWHRSLAPTESIALPNCDVKSAPKVNDKALELTETTFNTGAGMLFGRTSSRKFTLRAGSREEAAEWIGTLKSQRK